VAKADLQLHLGMCTNEAREEQRQRTVKEVVTEADRNSTREAVRSQPRFVGRLVNLPKDGPSSGCKLLPRLRQLDPAIGSLQDSAPELVLKPLHPAAERRFGHA
jgi:hypothetical protein